VNAVDAPVTLKIRTGWDQHSKNALQIANIAEQEGICALAIHGRTRADRFLGNAEYDSIAEVKQAISIPVLANGDIDSPEKARYVLDYTKADGLLIGRAAQGRPWIFQEISYFLRTGEKLAPRPIREIKEILSAHLVKMHDFYGSTMGVRIARKHIHWYLGRFPDATLLRRDINQVVCPEAQLDCIANYLQRLEQLGVEHAA
ncbi:MAG: tRNA dihydrouridine synthase DusB, partial [Gammaproteobacteria bacterium]|nr:tRNA dihydrouridine synthase DusB [Gammaproteobacteria bacterium]